MINLYYNNVRENVWLASLEKGPKGQNFTFWAFTPSGFTNIFSIQKYEIFVFIFSLTLF